MKKITFYFILFIISSCKDSETVFIKDFPLKNNLLAEKKILEVPIAPRFFTINSEYLLISSTPKDTMIDVFKIPDLSYITSFGQKGQGPNEFNLFPMFCHSMDDKIYVWGYNNLQINQLGIDQDLNIIIHNKFYFPLYEEFNQIHFINDSVLVYNLPVQEISLKKINILTGKELGQIKMEKDDHNETYFYSNRGILAANEKYLVYAYIFKKQIDIYDSGTLKLIKRIKANNSNENIIIGDFQNTIYQYIDIKCGDKYIYALYNNTGNAKRLLEIYNYEGLPIAEYTLSDRPSNIIYDKKNNLIFSFDNSQEDYILKYDIN